MKIDELLTIQAEMTQAHQVEFQLLVKRAIKKYGINNPKIREVLKNELSRFAEKATRQGLNLGLDWLKNGKTDNHT